MGLMQRQKGKRFERLVADRYRKIFPGRSVRRTIQSQRPWEADVVVEGIPLWTECQDARSPNPAEKMKQATRDERASRNGSTQPSIVVVVWHRLAERRINATLRLRDLVQMTLGMPAAEAHAAASDALVTLDFEDFSVLVLRLWGDQAGRQTPADSS